MHKQPHYVCWMRVAHLFFIYMYVSSLVVYLFFLWNSHSLLLHHIFLLLLFEWILFSCGILMYKYYKCPAVYGTHSIQHPIRAIHMLAFFPTLFWSLLNVYPSDQQLHPNNPNLIIMHKNVSTLVYVKFIILLKFHTHTNAYLTSSFFTVVYIYLMEIKEKEEQAEKKKWMCGGKKASNMFESWITTPKHTGGHQKEKTNKHE